jgi:hypothetical protein
MEILWSIAGLIVGWITPEMIPLMGGKTIPAPFNVGLAFVGALAGYQLAL